MPPSAPTPPPDRGPPPPSDSTPSRSGRASPRSGNLLVGGFILLLVVGLGVWWIQRSVEARAREDALAAWAGVPLPSPGEPVDEALADLGAELFRQKCAACHVIYGESHVGPELAGVTHRRSLPWIQAMILRPDSMTGADPAARSLKARYGVQMMVPGGIDTVETRAVLEFLRRVDGPPPTG